MSYPRGIRIDVPSASLSYIHPLGNQPRNVTEDIRNRLDNASLVPATLGLHYTLTDQFWTRWDGTSEPLIPREIALWDHRFQQALPAYDLFGESRHGLEELLRDPDLPPYYGFYAVLWLSLLEPWERTLARRQYLWRAVDMWFACACCYTHPQDCEMLDRLEPRLDKELSYLEKAEMRGGTQEDKADEYSFGHY